MPCRYVFRFKTKCFAIALDGIVETSQIGKGVSHIVKCRAKVRMDRQCHLITFNRLMRLHHPVEHDASVIPGIVVKRIKREMFFITPEGFDRLVEVVVTVPHLVPCVLVTGVSFNKESENMDRFFVSPGLLQRDSFIEESIEIFGVDRQRLIKTGNCIVSPSEIIQRDSTIDEDFRVVGIEREGLVVAL